MRFLCRNSLFRTVIVIVLTGGSLAACETFQNRKPLGTVCLTIRGVPAPEAGFLTRRTSELLTKAGFVYGTNDCDGTLVYERFSSKTGSASYQGWGGPVYYPTANEEGIASLSRGGQLVYQDRRIDLQGYSTSQDLLQDLAKELVRPLSKQFVGKPPA